jgi:hypothetical protein
LAVSELSRVTPAASRPRPASRTILSCLFLGDEAFVTYHATPAGEAGAPFTHERWLRAVRISLEWLYA